MGVHQIWKIDSTGDFFSPYWGHSGEAFGYESMAGHDVQSGGSFFVATTSCGMELCVSVPLFSSYLEALSKAEAAVANATSPTSEGPTRPAAGAGTQPPADGGSDNGGETSSAANLAVSIMHMFLFTSIFGMLQVSLLV